MENNLVSRGGLIINSVELGSNSDKLLVINSSGEVKSITNEYLKKDGSLPMTGGLTLKPGGKPLTFRDDDNKEWHLESKNGIFQIVESGVQIWVKIDNSGDIQASSFTKSGGVNNNILLDGGGVEPLSNIAKTSDIPTNNNELENGAGYITDDDIQIGGRNLFENSANISVGSLDENHNHNGNNEYDKVPIEYALEKAGVGTTITISFDVKAVYGNYLNVYCSNTDGETYFSPPKTFSNFGSEKQRLSFTTQVVSGTNVDETELEFYSRYDTGDFYRITNIKIEIGNQATDWSPAPEDKANKTITIETGTGLDGGGDLSTDMSIGINSSTMSKINNGDTAHGWGNHANGGYAKTKSDIGLSNVQNVALNWSWGTDTPSHIWGSQGSSSQSYVYNSTAVKAFLGLSKSDVGLENVTNDAQVKKSGDTMNDDLRIVKNVSEGIGGRLDIVNGTYSGSHRAAAELNIGMFGSGNQRDRSAFIQGIGHSVYGDTYFLSLGVRNRTQDSDGILVLHRSGRVGIGIGLNTPAQMLEVNGNIQADDFIGSSDERRKENIEFLSISEVKSTYKTFNFIGKPQPRVGVIAQELEKNHPEFVRTDDNGDKSVSYQDLHSAEIAYLKKENKDLKTKVEQQEDRINKLEELVKNLING